VPTNPLTTVGLMLTLAGLVGSFFNIQLTQWLRDLVALHQKALLNKAQGTEPQQRAIVECKIEFQKLTHGQTYAVNLLVLGFVIFVLVDGLLMIGSASTDPLYPYINVALWVFLVFFVCVSGWLLQNGRCVAQQISTILNAPAA
jgi:hypothetical protein